MFRLHRMLEWKKALEREAWGERIAAERRAGALEDAIDRFRRMRDSLPGGEPAAEGEAGIQELAQWARYAEGLRDREHRLQARLDRFRPRLEEKIRNHVDLRREVKGLAKLQERTRATQKRATERKQQEALDDAASRTILPGPGTEFLNEVGGSATGARPGTTEKTVGNVVDSNRGTRT